MRQEYFGTYHLKTHKQRMPLLHLTFHNVTRKEIRIPAHLTSTNEDLFLVYSEELAPSKSYVRMIPGGAWGPKHRCYLARYMCGVLGIPMEATRHLLRQVSPCPRGNTFNSVSINVGRIFRRVYDYTERPELLQFVWDWIIDHLPSGHKTVAADKSAVEALEKIKFGCGGCDVSDGQCVICMDDFEDGVELTKMPCSHAFHTNCLTKWLEINHVCPLCRFPVPVPCSDCV